MAAGCVPEWQVLGAADGAQVHFQRWLPQGEPRAVIQVAHGAAEHSARYAGFAQALTGRGFAVYAMDHRGHGRTRLRSQALGDGGPDAWNRTVDDEIALARLVREWHPRVPLAFFGHSLGSFMAQDLVTRCDLVDALVLSGTAWRAAPPEVVLAMLDEAAGRDPLGDSGFWTDRFREYNKPFGGPSGLEWLSRDADEVHAYVADPWCGFAFSNELARDIMRGFAAMRAPGVEARMRPGLPVLVVVGGCDPIGGEGLSATRELVHRWQALGARLEHRFYPGARHELLHETNRDEVTADVLEWLVRSC